MKKIQPKFSNNFFSCKTPADKIVSFLILAIGASLFSFTLDYCVHLVIGPTSLGGMHNIYQVCFFLMCCLTVSFFWVFRHDAQTRPENIYLGVILTITCLSSLSFSINEVGWDVGDHYKYVTEWTELDRTKIMTEADAEMAYLAENRIELNLASLSEWEDSLNEKDDSLSSNIVEGSRSELYKRISSLPASAIYALCTVLNMSFSSKYILSRLIYAFIYSFVTYLGMRRLKSGKMLYAVIALLPTAVFIASSYSYDYWVNAFILFATAALIGEMQRPESPLTIKRTIFILGGFFIGLGPKAIYFPLVLLGLLMPRKKFSSKKSLHWYRFAVVGTCLLVAFSFLVPYFFMTGPGIGDMRGGGEVNSTEQISFILSSPLEYAKILFAFLADYLSLTTARSYTIFYAYLGYSSWPFWIVIMFLIFFTTLTDKSASDVLVCNWKTRSLAIVVFFTCTILVATSLYISFTAVQSQTIAGCQPRYLIPLLFPLFVFLSSPKLAWPRSDDKKTFYNLAILGTMSFILLVGLGQVYFSLLH